jgi:hypothetical protein
MPIRRTSYVKLGKPITLAFVSCVADQHPEAAADDTQTTPAPPKFNPEHRAPRLITKFTAQDRIQYEQVIRRVLRHRP